MPSVSGETARLIYRFGRCELHTGPRVLLREGKAVRCQAKVFDLLQYLLENAGRSIEKDELLEPNGFRIYLFTHVIFLGFPPAVITGHTSRSDMIQCP